MYNQAQAARGLLLNTSILEAPQLLVDSLRQHPPRQHSLSCSYKLNTKFEKSNVGTTGTCERLFLRLSFLLFVWAVWCRRACGGLLSRCPRIAQRRTRQETRKLENKRLFRGRVPPAYLLQKVSVAFSPRSRPSHTDMRDKESGTQIKPLNTPAGC